MVRRKKEEDRSLQKGRSQRTGDGKKLAGNSGSGKSLTMYSHMHSSLCTHCEMYQADIKNDWNIRPVKLGCQDEGHPRKWSQMIYYFICFPLLLLFHTTQKYQA